MGFCSPSSEAKALIVREASLAAERLCLRAGIAVEGACIVYAAAVIRRARQDGISLVLQAGSAFWPRVRPEQDDGVSSTHFGYQWDPPNVLGHLMAGNLPELHAWAGDPRTQEIVDLTAGKFPEQCLKLTGMDWPGDRPPSSFWGRGRDLPGGASYEPNLEATTVAAHFLQELARSLVAR